MILSIDTSCDDTSAAVITLDSKVLSNIISSQTHIHTRFGGVVPELACRFHVEYIDEIVQQALDVAGVTIGDIQYVAPTIGPGLSPALLIGLTFAKGLAASQGITFLPIHHLEGHLLSPFVHGNNVPDHAVGLVISGGHTELYEVKGLFEYEKLGSTQDDAVGEAYDKVAKMLGLGYPGGPILEKRALDGNQKAIPFPRPMIKNKNCHFSFSGLKTAVMVYLRNNETYSEADVCASFQRAVLDTLISKSQRAVDETGANKLAVCGGVSCNQFLRNGLTDHFQKRGVETFFAQPEYCTDNAAMIGFVASKYVQQNRIYDQSRLETLDAHPNFTIATYHDLIFT